MFGCCNSSDKCFWLLQLVRQMFLVVVFRQTDVFGCCNSSDKCIRILQLVRQMYLVVASCNNATDNFGEILILILSSSLDDALGSLFVRWGDSKPFYRTICAFHIMHMSAENKILLMSAVNKIVLMSAVNKIVHMSAEHFWNVCSSATFQYLPAANSNLPRESGFPKCCPFSLFLLPKILFWDKN